MVYVVAAVAIARQGRRRGWQDDRPGALNLVGVLPLTAGAGFLGAAIVAHYRESPAEMGMSVVPEYLVRGGVYGVTRNPMYVGGALMLTGWTILFGSARLAPVCAVFVGGMNFAGIPFEERMLHRRFGASYDTYRAAVPRWL